MGRPISALAIAALVVLVFVPQRARGMRARTSAEAGSVDLALQAANARLAFDQRTGLYALTLSGATASLGDTKVQADRALAQVISKACRSKHLKAALATRKALQGEGGEHAVTLSVWSAKFLAREGLLELQVWPTSMLGPRDAKALRRTRKATIATKLQAWAQGATDVHVVMEVPTHLAADVKPRMEPRPHHRALQTQAASLFNVTNPAFFGSCADPNFGEGLFLAAVTALNTNLVIAWQVESNVTGGEVFDILVNLFFNGTVDLEVGPVSSPYEMCAWNALVEYALANAPVMGTDQDFANVTAVLEQLWPLTQAYLALPSNASVADKGDAIAAVLAVLGDTDALDNLAVAADGTVAAGLVLYLPYAGLVLGGLNYLNQNALQIPAVNATLQANGASLDDLVIELQTAIQVVQQIAGTGLTQLGYLNDLYSTSPDSDPLLAAAFQNQVAISKNVQATFSLFPIFDVSVPAWNVSEVAQTLTSPVLGAWTAWEPATVDAFAENGVGNLAPWDITGVTGVVVQSAAWADGNGCTTWGVTSILFITGSGDLEIGTNVTADSNCTSCYTATAIANAFWNASAANLIDTISGEFLSSNPNVGFYQQLGLAQVVITTTLNNSLVSVVRSSDNGQCASEASSFALDLNPDGLNEWAGRAWLCGVTALPPRSGPDGVWPPFVGPLTIDGCFMDWLVEAGATYRKLKK